jgi:hypothetical protein
MSEKPISPLRQRMRSRINCSEFSDEERARLGHSRIQIGPHGVTTGQYPSLIHPIRLDRRAPCHRTALPPRRLVHK